MTNTNKLLIEKIYSSFNSALLVDQQNARKLNLISQERKEIESFLRRVDPKELSVKEIMSLFGYDFTGFFSFLTGHEIYVLMPSLARMMLLENEDIEDLDLCFLSMLSRSDDYDQSRANAFKSQLSKDQLSLVQSLVCQLFEILDNGTIDFMGLQKEKIISFLQADSTL